jgi:O-antigen/teichoic acid export membrane protein
MSRALAAAFGPQGTKVGLALFDCLVVGGTNLLTVLLLGRISGPDDLGVFALVMTVFYLLLAVQEPLITTPYTIYGVRLRQRRRRQYAGAAFAQCMAWSACVSTILALTAAVIYFSGESTSLASVVAVFAIVTPFWLLREFGRRYLFANMHVAKVVAMSVVGCTIQIAILCALAYRGQLSAASALAAVGVGSGVAGLGWFWLSRPAFQFNHSRWLHFAVKNWVLGRWVFASHSMAVVAAYAMPWLVLVWLGPAATGVFAACDSILRFANPIIVSLSNILTPKAAIGLTTGGKEQLRRIVWKATAILGVFLLGFCVMLVIAGRWLLDLSFGENYGIYWPTLVVLGVNQLVAKLAIGPSRALMVVERANANLYAEAAGFLTSLAAAIVLIPVYGVLGAAIAQFVGGVALTSITFGAYRTAMLDDEIGAFLSIGRINPTPATAGRAAE